MFENDKLELLWIRYLVNQNFGLLKTEQYHRHIEDIDPTDRIVLYTYPIT